MEKDVIEEILKERVEENKKLFSEKELMVINKNDELAKKVYLLGLINGKDIYEIK